MQNACKALLTKNIAHSEKAKTVAIAFLGSLFLAAMSQISFPLPFSPVPMSMQTFALFMMAGTLGPTRALYSVLLYLLEGSFGLPVFAGGMANPLWLLSPKGGYLIGFAPAVWVSGTLIFRKTAHTFLSLTLSLIAGQLLLYLCGASWLSYFVGPSQAIALGVFPFLPTALIKIAASASLLKGIGRRQ